MNTPNDLRWLLFATVPYHRYFDVTALTARGIVPLGRRIGHSVQASHERVAERRQRAPRTLEANSMPATPASPSHL